ncbi:hypothetical protein [Niveibacterium sp. SC-1]|uniref:hypothetical protein n=1 Tax=Niveibacterium sp. SC-1 TaxID=3135646 RepID=UPI00311F1F6E
MKSAPAALRLALLLPAPIALLAGVLSGLARLGLPLPAWFAGFIGQHGALMVCGVFGTLISLERAVARNTPAAYAVPAACGIATLALLAGAPATIVAAIFVAASAGLLWQAAALSLRHREWHLACLALAAAAWLAGNLAWLHQLPLESTATLPWTAFLILTIAAERLELSRLLPTPRHARIVFCVIATTLLLAAGADALVIPHVSRLYGAALGALAIWLARYDLARRTARIPGLTGYIGRCLLSGYAWLALGGLLALFGALDLGSPLRDATLHALMLGFVFTMVFGHAPIILPAVARVRLGWHRGFYLPLLALHASLAWRVVAGLAGNFAARQSAASLNAASLLLFLLLVLTALRRRETKRP